MIATTHCCDDVVIVPLMLGVVDVILFVLLWSYVGVPLWWYPVFSHAAVVVLFLVVLVVVSNYCYFKISNFVGGILFFLYICSILDY